MVSVVKIVTAVIGAGIIADFLIHPTGTTALGNSAVSLTRAGGSIITGTE